jgi:hypothetical protein
MLTYCESGHTDPSRVYTDSGEEVLVSFYHSPDKGLEIVRGPNDRMSLKLHTRQRVID